MMQALRCKTLKRRRQYRKPNSAHTDRSSYCGSLPAADDGSEVEEQNQHSPKRPTMPKRPPGVFWSTHKAVQECKDKHDEILQALEQAGKSILAQDRIDRGHLVTHVDGATELVNSSGVLDGLWQRKSSFSAIRPPEWERLILTVDSGASDTVVPPSVCSLAPLHMTNKVGIEYEVANGAVIENLGERGVQMKDQKSGKLLKIAFQVVDVHKPLLSVSKIIERGHKVLFSKEESYIELTSGEKLHLQSKDGVFELEVLVRSPDFARPSIKYNSLAVHKTP